MEADQIYKFDLYYLLVDLPPQISWRYTPEEFIEIPPEAFIHNFYSNESLYANIVKLNGSFVEIDGNLTVEQLIVESSSTLLITGDLTFTNLEIHLESPSSIVNISGCIFSGGSITVTPIPSSFILNYNCSDIPNIPISFTDDNNCLQIIYTFGLTTLDVIIPDSNCGVNYTTAVISTALSLVGLSIIILVIYFIVRVTPLKERMAFEKNM